MKNRPTWYLKPKLIRKRQNHSWKKNEILKVYKLRNQNLPVKEIIEKLRLNVNKIQVYNVVRMYRKNVNNKCPQCNKELEPNYQHKKIFRKCPECIEKNNDLKKRIRRNRIKINICACCGKEKPVIGNTTCVKCLSYIHRGRLLQDLCGNCGKHPISKKSTALCDNCLELNRINSNIYRKREKKCK